MVILCYNNVKITIQDIAKLVHPVLKLCVQTNTIHLWFKPIKVLWVSSLWITKVYLSKARWIMQPLCYTPAWLVSSLKKLRMLSVKWTPQTSWHSYVWGVGDMRYWSHLIVNSYSLSYRTHLISFAVHHIEKKRPLNNKEKYGLFYYTSQIKKHLEEVVTPYLHKIFDFLFKEFGLMHL